MISSHCIFRAQPLNLRLNASGQRGPAACSGGMCRTSACVNTQTADLSHAWDTERQPIYNKLTLALLIAGVCGRGLASILRSHAQCSQTCTQTAAPAVASQSGNALFRTATVPSEGKGPASKNSPEQKKGVTVDPDVGPPKDDRATTPSSAKTNELVCIQVLAVLIRRAKQAVKSSCHATLYSLACCIFT